MYHYMKEQEPPLSLQLLWAE